MRFSKLGNLTVRFGYFWTPTVRFGAIFLFFRKTYGAVRSGFQEAKILRSGAVCGWPHRTAPNRYEKPHRKEPWFSLRFFVLLCLQVVVFLFLFLFCSSSFFFFKCLPHRLRGGGHDSFVSSIVLFFHVFLLLFLFRFLYLFFFSLFPFVSLFHRMCMSCLSYPVLWHGVASPTAACCAYSVLHTSRGNVVSLRRSFVTT